MKPTFTSITGERQGIIASMLRSSYAELLEMDSFWQSECANWEQYDKEVFTNPETVGFSIFLTRVDGDIVGFASWDPRQRPEYGIIGHNCVLPDFRGRGLGKIQISEVLRRLRVLGIRMVKVSTNDHSFFVPAQRMYAACGFHEVGRKPCARNPKMTFIEYENELR